MITALKGDMVTPEYLLDPAWDELSAVRAAQQGEPWAFDQLVLKYEATVYRTAYYILQNKDDAIDATQTALFNAFRSLDRCYIHNFRGWLMRIVSNASYDLLRARKRHVILSLDVIREDLEEDIAKVSDTNELPEAWAERNELNRAIDAGINKLRTPQRIVLVLADVYSYSYEEIALLMGCPLGTVKSSLSRARANLRNYLLRCPDVLPRTFQQRTPRRQSAKFAQLPNEATCYHKTNVTIQPHPLPPLHFDISRG